MPHHLTSAEESRKLRRDLIKQLDVSRLLCDSRMVGGGITTPNLLDEGGRDMTPLIGAGAMVICAGFDMLPVVAEAKASSPGRASRPPYLRQPPAYPLSSSPSEEVVEKYNPPQNLPPSPVPAVQTLPRVPSPELSTSPQQPLF
jgi:hypothetical protein